MQQGLGAVPGLVDVGLTEINGNAHVVNTDTAGIVMAVGTFGADTFFNAQYPFPETS